METKKRFGIGIMLAVLCVATGFVQAQDEELNGVFSEVVPAAALAVTAETPPVVSVAVREPIKRLSDYDLPGLATKVILETIPGRMNVVDVIHTLARQAQLNNVVIGKGVAGDVSRIKFDDVPVGEALEIFLGVNQLAFELNGAILTVMTDQEYKSRYGRSFYDKRGVEIVKLRFADPSRVATMLTSVKSDIGTVVGDPVTGNMILQDVPSKIAEMKAVIAKADIPTISRVIPTVTEHFRLQYADVEEIQSELTAVLTKEAGSMQVNTRTRTLIVTDLEHNLPKIREMVRLFDARPKQVFIEAKIVEISLNDTFSLGVNWNHFFQGLDPRFSLQSVSAPGGPVSSIGTLTYNTIVADGDLQAVLTALKQIGKTKIISNPQIAVEDSKEAEIKVIERQPYKIIGLETGTTNVTEVSFEFVDVGVQLSVTPRINEENFINVDIKPEISSISSWYDGAPQEGTPVIKTSTAQTTVLVKDGVTIIIGGMIRDQEDKVTSSVPFLGRIPLVGRLFRHDSTTVANVETVVFMTPRIVTGEESFLRLKDIKKPLKGLRTVGGARPMKPIR